MVVLTHINDMIMIQNTILGEQFKGLNESFVQLLSRQSSSEILCEEFKILTTNLIQFSLEFKEQEKKLNSAFSENSDLLNDLNEMRGINIVQKKQLETLSSKAKEKFKYMLEEINILRQEKIESKAELNETEKNIKALTEEIELLKNKLKQFKLRKNVDSENSDEKMCQKCKKLYKESENFNWSCKTHASQCANDYWWCCGKKGEYAAGCQAGRHESREDESEKLQNEDLIKSSMLCSSCKSLGHNLFNCPKDPNAKSGAEVKQELERLEALKKHKASNCIGIESNQKVFELLMNKGALAFANESSSHEQNSSEDSLEQEEGHFGDIMGIKRTLDLESQTVRVI